MDSPVPIYRVYEWKGYYPTHSGEPVPTGLWIEAESYDAIPTAVWVSNPEDEWRLYGWEGEQTTMTASQIAYSNTGGLQRGIMVECGPVPDDDELSDPSDLTA
jgi:hypothetical protein